MTDNIMASSTCKEFYAGPSTNACTSSAPTPWIGETSGAVGWGDIWRNSGRDAVRGADAHGDDTTGASSAPGGAKFENNMKHAFVIAKTRACNLICSGAVSRANWGVVP